MTTWRRRASLCSRTCAWLSPFRAINLGYGLPQADLIQEGNVGLMKAVRRFDPERGRPAWCRSRCTGSGPRCTNTSLRNWRLVKLATTKAQRKLFFNLRSMKGSTAALTHAQADDIRAGALGVKREEVLEMEDAAVGQRRGPRPDSGRRGRDHADRVSDRHGRRGPVQILERAETARKSERGACSAPSRSSTTAARRIIEARWLKETDPATLQELADEYGVSAERIRQIESKAIKTMRSQMS